MSDALKDLITVLNKTADALQKEVDALPKEDPFQLAPVYFRLKTDYDQLDTARKRVYALVDKMNKAMMPEALDANGGDLIRIPEIGRSFGFTSKMSVSMIDKEAGMKWLKDEGHGDLIQPTVNASTLAAFAKSLLLEDGMDLPDDIFKTSTYRNTTMTRYTPKKT
jgi:hypothetical protein